MRARSLNLWAATALLWTLSGAWGQSRSDAAVHPKGSTRRCWQKLKLETPQPSFKSD